MRPVLFHFRGIPINSYPAMLYVGLLAAVLAGNFVAHASGLNAFRVYVATIILIIPAIIGARLLHVFAHWKLYLKNPARIFDRSESGYGMYGGLPLALALAVPTLYLLRIPFGAFWDVGIVSILAGMIFARIGCLLQGCCCGRVTNGWFSLYLPNHLGEWRNRIPSQSLESLWALTLLVAALILRPHMPFPGALCAFVCCAYPAGRLVLETFREPEQGSTSRFTLYHAISVAIMVVAIATLSAKWPR
jgi:phosphatidylglycerol---prolipoprotein diacylglyceryl transferase